MSLPLKGKPQVIVAAVLAFPLVLLLVSTYSKKAALNDLLVSSGHTIDLFTENLRGGLDKFEYLPKVLAESDKVIALLLDDKNDKHVDQVNRYLDEVNEFAGASDIYVMNREGLTIVASNWDMDKTFVGKNFSFRPYFTEAITGGSGRYFALGSTSKKRGYYYSYPVKQNDEIIGVLVVKVGLAMLESSWEKNERKIVLTDKNGVIFITNSPEWSLKTIRPLPEEKLAEIRESRQYGEARLDPLDFQNEQPYKEGSKLVTLDKTRYLMRTSLVQGYSWIIHIMFDTGLVRMRVVQSTALAGFLYIIVVLGWLYIYQRRLNISQRLAYQEKVEQTLLVAQDELEEKIKERTAELEKAQDSLIQSSKLAAMGKFSAGLAHEINQPLAAMQFGAYNAKMFIERGQKDGALENIERITALTNRLAKMTSQLKVYARRGDHTKSMVPFNQAIDNALSLVEMNIQSEGINVVKTLLDEEAFILCDQIQLEQVFINLFKNAIDAMTDSKTRDLDISSVVEGKYVVSTIRDTGRGIDPDDLKELFEAFFTTKQPGKGLGLGLAITHGAVKKMGGTIEVQNHESGGAVFIVTLPKADKLAGAE